MDTLELLKNILYRINMGRATTIGLEFYPYEGHMDYNITEEGEVRETFDSLNDAIDYLDSIDMD